MYRHGQLFLEQREDCSFSRIQKPSPSHTLFAALNEVDRPLQHFYPLRGIQDYEKTV